MYRYVGPAELLAQVQPDRAGYPIQSQAALIQWLDGQPAEPFTFVVDPAGVLRLAPRRSEHVACAGGSPVLSAGEITFDQGEVVEVSNQSTGYCPDVTSWPAVARALDRAGVPHPDGFTHAIVFRRCPDCSEINIVRDSDYVCVFCGNDLPLTWNVAALS